MVLLLSFPHGSVPLESQQKVAHLFSYARLDSLDDSLPALYTNEFVFNLRSPRIENEQIRLGVLFVNPTNSSETIALDFYSYTEFDGTQFLMTNASGFYHTKWMWRLLKCGSEFPFDALCWFMLVGSNYRIEPAFQQAVVLYDSEKITERWVFATPSISEFYPSQSNNQALTSLGIQPETMSDYLKPYHGLDHWYLVQMNFIRQYAEKVRLTGLFWIPSLGLFVTVMTPLAFQIYAHKRRRRFRLTLSQSLTFYLTSALFAFPFILSIMQYTPPYAITFPELLFYADASLAFVAVIYSISLEYHNSNRPLRAGS